MGVTQLSIAKSKKVKPNSFKPVVDKCCSDAKCKDNTNPIQVLKQETDISIHESDIRQNDSKKLSNESEDKKMFSNSILMNINTDDKTYTNIELYHELRILNYFQTLNELFIPDSGTYR